MSGSLPPAIQPNHTADTLNGVESVHTACPGPLAAIPTSDPLAALHFCQSLAHVLSHTNGATVAGLHQPLEEMLLSPLPPDISVVLPVYNEEENLPELYQRLTTVLDATGLQYELVFVDDGSHDSSLAQLEALSAQDQRVVAVELARNFGHQIAISAGLAQSRGRGVIVMDSDLQDPPEALPQFIHRWQEGYDVVYAIRTQRKEGWLKQMSYKLFYRLLQRAAHIEIPLDSGDFCIMDRRVVDMLTAMPERNRFVRGIRSWVGLRQTGLAYERHARHAGQPKYTLTRLIRLALDGIISFSYMPLKFIMMVGLAISLLSIFIAIFYTIKKLTVGLSPPGFATLTVAIFFLSGIQLITLGVMGEYVGRIFEEVKQRPLYVVRRVVRQTTHSVEPDHRSA